MAKNEPLCSLPHSNPIIIMLDTTSAMVTSLASEHHKRLVGVVSGRVAGAAHHPDRSKADSIILRTVEVESSSST